MRIAKSFPGMIAAAILAGLTAAAIAADAPAAPPKKPAADAPANPPADATPDPATKEVAITFTGGYDTEGVDRGRPVILIAAALNVPAEVFRKAFINVKPAPAGSEPEPEQVRKNKAVLMAALEPYGVTDDRLNEVSNYYRYNRSKGDMWKHAPATATATVANGVVTAITLTSPGAGYSSAPKIAIPGVTNPAVTVTLAFGTDLKTNGSIKAIAPAPAK